MKVKGSIVDAAGAGDWCTAGIIHSLCLDGYSQLNKTGIRRIKQSLEFGSALGAMNCLYDGARGLMYQYTLPALLSKVDHLMADREIVTFPGVSHLLTGQRNITEMVS